MSVHNAWCYVAEAIRSVLAQTHREFEFIIADDGSTDGTLDILQEFERQDSRADIAIGIRILPGKLSLNDAEIRTGLIHCEAGLQPADADVPQTAPGRELLILGKPEIDVAIRKSERCRHYADNRE